MNFRLALLLVALCAIPPVFAKPPPEVVDEGRDAVVVHNGLCDTKKHRDVRCLVGEKPNGDLLILLFRNDRLFEVIRYRNQEETVLWSVDAT